MQLTLYPGLCFLENIISYLYWQSVSFPTKSAFENHLPPLKNTVETSDYILGSVASRLSSNTAFAF